MRLFLIKKGADRKVCTFSYVCLGLLPAPKWVVDRFSTGKLKNERYFKACVERETAVY